MPNKKTYSRENKLEIVLSVLNNSLRKRIPKKLTRQILNFANYTAARHFLNMADVSMLNEKYEKRRLPRRKDKRKRRAREK
ncbi:hypothetical protein [Zunongwangia endophytica]|uniref:hypothetical protein n=1 Tax=Zunongwangia endophytica TaxID=1808945 RepID=UPI0025B4900E|nr:hypothetical protein [Zunongwangia endophytica]MDN3593692.1 hypothetical protein [Zunongwangia endophytica]